MRRHALLLILAVMAFIASAGGALAKDDPASLLQQAVTASRAGMSTEAISLASRAIELAPKDVRAWITRASIYEEQGQFDPAAADCSEAIRLDPKASVAWQRRGEVQFKRGKFAESVADFDQFLTLEPEERPYHWQRGISLYYAGRFADGKRQFELHQTVNPHDVENAVWHFLCTARAEGLAAARKQLIPIENDARVPMAQVHQLFAGKATPKDVLAAAEAAPAATRAGEPLFYAHLYLGLYYEATGDKARARESILKAAARAKENGYMGDVARVHARTLHATP